MTYNQFGGYGHPDHVQAHRVAMYGKQLAGAPGVPPRPGRGVDGAPGAVEHHEQAARMIEGIRALRDAGDFETFKGFNPEGGLTPDDLQRRQHRRR